MFCLPDIFAIVGSRAAQTHTHTEAQMISQLHAFANAATATNNRGNGKLFCYTAAHRKFINYLPLPTADSFFHCIIYSFFLLLCLLTFSLCRRMLRFFLLLLFACFPTRHSLCDMFVAGCLAVQAAKEKNEKGFS